MEPSINKEAYKFGLINGLLAIVILYGTWAAGTETFISFRFVDIWIPYMAAILLIGGFQLRKKQGGFLPFKEALKFTFLSYVIAGVLIAIATYILYNVIDKDLTERSFQEGLIRTKRWMEKFGASDEQIEKAISDAEKNKTETGIKTIFMGFGIGLIWDFIKSMLVSLIIRKEKPQTF